MLLRVWNGPSGPATGIEEADDFSSLMIQIAEGLSLDDVRLALTGVASLPDRDEGLINVEALQALSGRHSDAQWADDFAEMIAKAERAGWMTTSSDVRAHCEWLDVDGS